MYLFNSGMFREIIQKIPDGHKIQGNFSVISKKKHTHTHEKHVHKGIDKKCIIIGASKALKELFEKYTYTSSGSVLCTNTFCQNLQGKKKIKSCIKEIGVRT